MYLYGVSANVQISVTDLSCGNLMFRKDVLTTNGIASVSLQPFGRGVYIVNVRDVGDGIMLDKNIKVVRR